MSTPVVTPGQDQLPPVDRSKQPDPEMAAMRAEMSRMTATVGRLAQNQQPARTVQPQPANGTPSAADLKKQFFEDPLQSSAIIAKQVTDHVMAQTTGASFDTLVTVARNEARKAQPEVWDSYEAEIIALVEANTGNIPLSRQNVNVWLNGARQVAGAHLDDLVKKKTDAAAAAGDNNRAPAFHISKDGGPAPAGSASARGANNKVQLSDDERTIARGLGLSDESYHKGKELLEGQNYKPSEKSSWDKYMTFNTKEQRRAARAAKQANNDKK